MKMLPTVKGYFEKGKVFLSEAPPVAGRTEVIVTFLSEESIKKKVKRKLGGLEGKLNVPDDFNAPLDDLREYM